MLPRRVFFNSREPDAEGFSPVVTSSFCHRDLLKMIVLEIQFRILFVFLRISRFESRELRKGFHAFTK
jgi:hypothetical protein